LSPVHYTAQPSKEQQELRAKAWRLDWRRKVGEDTSIFREVYPFPTRYKYRDILAILLMIIVMTTTGVGGMVWISIANHDDQPLAFGAIILVVMCLAALLLIFGVNYDYNNRPKWNVLQLTKRHLIYTPTSDPDFDFLRMVRSEAPLTYPYIGVELESIREINEAFGSYFLREKDGSRQMVLANLSFKPKTPYYGIDMEFPVPVPVLRSLVEKLKERIPSLVISPKLKL
jgi:hypothetical protein